MGKWVRITANMSLGAYEIFEATGDLPDPTWPDLALFAELAGLSARKAAFLRMAHSRH
jgi:hypothetical protein